MLKCDFRSVISIKLLCNFMEIGLRHGCSPVNVLHIFRTTFLKNASGWLLLNIRINKNIIQNNNSKSTKMFYDDNKYILTLKILKFTKAH